MTAVKEVQQKYFLKAEEMPLFPPLQLHMQHADFLIPENYVILEAILETSHHQLYCLTLDAPRLLTFFGEKERDSRAAPGNFLA